MEFRINQAEFVRGLRLAQSIADRKSTMPLLANVLLRVQSKSKLLVTATDLNVSLSAELKISDFGLSHNGGDLKLEQIKNVPIKWLAPETFSEVTFPYFSSVCITISISGPIPA